MDSKGQSSPPAASAGTMSSSKDVEMKDAEEEKPKEKEAEEDPKQAQKDKDLLTFEGKAAIYTPWWALIRVFTYPSVRCEGADEADRERGEPEGAQIHPQGCALSPAPSQEDERRHLAKSDSHLLPTQ